MVGAEYLTAAGGPGSVGGYYYEVEVLDAEGYLWVGFAGTNLGTQCTGVGDDACSWGYNASDGRGYHGCAWVGEGVRAGKAAGGVRVARWAGG